MEEAEEVHGYAMNILMSLGLRWKRWWRRRRASRRVGRQEEDKGPSVSPRLLLLARPLQQLGGGVPRAAVERALLQVQRLRVQRADGVRRKAGAHVQMESKTWRQGCELSYFSLGW
jgi:hypothetical protein